VWSREHQTREHGYDVRGPLRRPAGKPGSDFAREVGGWGKRLGIAKLSASGRQKGQHVASPGSRVRFDLRRAANCSFPPSERAFTTEKGLEDPKAH